MNEQTEQFILDEVVIKEIDRWLAKYPTDQKRSAVVPALLFVQKQNNGWLSKAAMNALADYLQLPRIWVYEVATFYDMYNLKPMGKHKISICQNVPCFLRGSDEIVACVKERLGIDFDETTSDGLFTLKSVECMAACGGAPMCQIDDQEYHENLTPEKMIAIIDKLERESKTNAD
ncbi:NADH-quinone oxidoreductase subunit NuoE [Coxiella burnetii]|uniref:NADH-quinone oxidoreductase subunit E n=1 Tax=Coxiella burnetii (strain RSA 493 / Nine Mile phase I) TaxID=227377 RepID=Q83BQ9_COXBU|nr:NADH-quinone oxidoreductase subunit NuoE [Coxiella burnetii]NP_820427.1 NADH-quinone oxidoreductase subunit E [Coxiella burnetii RSA 493]AAO90941.1 NADH-quinone oxidoreductase chain E [Coxiella burnetii RSA 493]ARI66220.1 NADH-quinone oxidoreductase subunit E [Coxiella burnetii]ARK27676.1 NAD(P)H-dependent oxidoreductase subunit E [Coxiella burnetii]MCF2093380.1 NADH-quinone oxidoreductase subunit NuoE [Coxiella burnetii]MCF2095855.1 NADH-quinone oxidoreductase subunit NuoE [Coxiella burne